MEHFTVALVLLLSSAQLLSASDPMIFPCFCECQNDEAKSKSHCAETETNTSKFDLIMRAQCVNSTTFSDDFWLGMSVEENGIPTFHYIGCHLPSWNFSLETVGGLGLLRGVKNMKLETRGERVKTMQFTYGFFENLTDLRRVSLENIGLHDVPHNLFWWSDGIDMINLSRNYLTTVPDELFRDNQLLYALDLSYNDLRILPDQVFSNTKKLVSLDLSWNRLSSISEHLFNGLSSLQLLNLEHNNLKLIHAKAFSSLFTLRFAKFSHNRLDLHTGIHDDFGEVSTFYNCHRLELIQLSHNNITKIYSDWAVNNYRLRELDLSYNAIDNLQAEDLQFVSDNVKVNLIHNEISTIDLSRVKSIANKQNTMGKVIVDLNYNPFHCDCKAYSLLRYSNDEMKQIIIEFITLKMQHLTCESPEKLKGAKFLNRKTKKWYCDPEEESTFDDPCAPGGICDCTFRPSNQTLIMNCSARNLTESPAEIFLDNANYVELDLSNNSLRVAPNLMRNGYEKVRSLNLIGNQIAYVDETLISPNLKTLKLNRNKLRSINESILTKIISNSNISLLTLHDNPWKCDIGYAALLSFVIDMYENIPDADDIDCTPVKPRNPRDGRLDTMLCYILYFLLIVQAIIISTHLYTLVVTCFEGCFDPAELTNRDVPVLEEPLPGPQNV